MMNNRGLGKFETLTIIVVLIAIAAFLLYSTLGAANSKDYSKFRSDAVNLNKAVFSNLDSFRNPDYVTLGEVISHNLIDDFKSPFSKNKCDKAESFVITEGQSRYVTLKCDEYLIDNVLANDLDDAVVYKVGEWQEEEITGANVQTAELYNCDDNGSNLLEQYVPSSYLVFYVNRTYGTSYYFSDGITACKVVKKTFYRTRELVEEGK